MIKKIRNWFNSLFGLYIVVNEETSDVYVSKALFKRIRKDHPSAQNYKVLFSRVRHKSMFCDGSNTTDYLMFFNPEWRKHGISNPNLILTSPLSVGKHGHVGFQTVQPTSTELLAVYGVSAPVRRLYVKREKINDEPYYRILRP